jgi:hypothetical protein
MTQEKIPVMVTTDKRGVFFGFIDPADSEKDPLRVENVQMCVYWSTGVQGVLGLAATGPKKDCKVTKPAPAGTIKGITMVTECSAEAVKAWKAQPWS